jgi:hypothetical protein
MTMQPIIAANSSGLPNQDYFVLGGGQSGGTGVSPGKCVVRGPNAPQGWDVRKGTALSYATLVPSGAEVQKFTIVVTVWSGSQYDTWKIFAGRYLVRAAVVVPGTISAKALSIVHPMLNDPPFLISECVVNDVVALEESDEGWYSYEIQFLGYRKPIPAIGKPAAAIPVAQQPQPTAEDKVIAANTALIGRLAGLAPPIP